MRDRFRAKTWAKIIAIALISVLSAEIFLRIYHFYHPLFIFYEETYQRFRGKPYANDWGFQLNSGGFKDVEFGEKEPGAYRIIGMGDSFAFSIVPYPYSYYTRLEEQLKESYGNQIEVLNMGIISTGPQDYLSLLVREGLALKPDMVIVSFFVGNDFFQSNREPQPRAWHTYSYLASLLHYIVNIRPQTVEGFVPPGKGEYCDSCPTYSPEAYLKIEYERSALYLDRNEPLLQKLTGDAVFYLAQMQELCARNDIDFVVVIIPDELQINPDLWVDVWETYYPELKEDEWDLSRPNALLTTALREHNISVIDLYEDYLRESDHQPLYRPQDSHINLAGNQLTADLIEANIQTILKNHLAP